MTNEQPDIHTLFRAVKEHPDFAGGTIFTRDDVAHALYDDDGDVCAPPEEARARVTEAQMIESAEVIEAWIFNHSYDWTEAMRDLIESDREARA
jgi:hypothetical protein